MGTSAIATLREIILEVVRYTAQGQWKVLVLDETSKRLVDSVVKQNDILQEKVTNIEQIEHKRALDQDLVAVYLLTPDPHIVEWLIMDLERRRYHRSHLVWTSFLPPELRQRIEQSSTAKEIAQDRILNINFFPDESHLITFRDPSSFPVLFHPACNQLVPKHMYDLAQRIVSVCVSLEEYPTIRYYRPHSPLHEAGVLCSHLARFVQEGLDQHAKHHGDFPPPSSRPRGVLIITDRSMDLFAPLLHEFTYQAMVHDLLPLKQGDRPYYKTVLNEGTSREEVKEMELGEQDKIWVQNRHMHMKDLLQKLVADFNKFRADNPQFAENLEGSTSISTIKDMIAGLPQFQEGKELYSLHLNMSQELMNIFQKCRLTDVALVEQSMAVGLDEDYKRPKNLTDQIVRLLDDDEVNFPDRLRLIIEYVLYRDGIFRSDMEKLLAHARLPAQDGEILQNLEMLGARVFRPLKDAKHTLQPLFPRKPPAAEAMDDLSLSRFEPAIKGLLEEQLRGTLDQNLFPYTKPFLDSNEGTRNQVNVSQASLRSAKPTWARTRPSASEPRQRVIIFMAGGATYSESRVCYEVSDSSTRDIYLTSSHMLHPGLFLRQLGELSVDRRLLDLPADRPKPKPPACLYEKDVATSNIASQSPGATMEPRNNRPATSADTSIETVELSQKPHPLPSPPFVVATPPTGKLSKGPKEKKRGFFKF
ncbi:vacuolar sorting protein VPS33/slp1 [Xylographa opegraphella]|nr:vacuolar sorting protein VPS33/slp1 [Xylographa opegraphella]